MVVEMKITPVAVTTFLLALSTAAAENVGDGRRYLPASDSDSASSQSPLGCPDPSAPLISSDFENGTGLGYPSDWYSNHYRSYASNSGGAPHERVFGHGDGRYANFFSRESEWHGPTHGVDWRCVDAGATYEFKARVRLDAPEGTTSSCQSLLTKCVYVALSLEDAHPTNPDDPSLNLHNWRWLGGQSTPSTDGVWFDLELTFQFDSAMTDSTKLSGAGIIRREIYLEGPEAGIEVGLDDVTLSKVVG